MHGVNLDLLRTTPHHPDGRPKDLHAHHRAEHVAALAEVRNGRRDAVLLRLARLMRRFTWQRRQPCP